MAIICPTVMAYDKHEYREQMERIQPFAKRVHIDLMDGHLTPFKSPEISYVWWPESVMADIHLMYRRPLPHLPALIKLRPHLVTIHAEAEVDHLHFAKSLHRVGIRAGLALLHDTTVKQVERIIKDFDHVVIFGGKLGRHSNQTDLSILDKVPQVKELAPDVEVAWDGGVNDKNAGQLVAAGVDVLNVGGFVQGSANPEEAYAKLKTVLQG